DVAPSVFRGSLDLLASGGGGEGAKTKRSLRCGQPSHALCVGCRPGVRLRYSKICPWRKRQMLIVFAAAAKASRMASTGSSSRVLQFAQSTRRKPSIDQ